MVLSFKKTKPFLFPSSLSPSSVRPSFLPSLSGCFWILQPRLTIAQLPQLLRCWLGPGFQAEVPTPGCSPIFQCLPLYLRLHTCLRVILSVPPSQQLQFFNVWVLPLMLLLNQVLLRNASSRPRRYLVKLFFIKQGSLSPGWPPLLHQFKTTLSY